MMKKRNAGALSAVLVCVFLSSAPAVAAAPASSGPAISPGQGGGFNGQPAVPVIIVPGICGSELAQGEDLLWPIDSSISAVRGYGDLVALIARDVDSLERLSCDPSASAQARHAGAVPAGAAPAVAASAIAALVVEPGLPAFTGRVGTGDSYGELYRALAKSMGADMVFFFGYDWRLDNDRSADSLAAFIREVERKTGAAEVDLVAHSMGGIVASDCLMRHAPRVRRAVFLGVPFEGAGEAFAALGDGASKSLASMVPADIAAASAKETTSLHGYAAKFRETLRGVVRGYVSLYELLTLRDFDRLAAVGVSPSSLEALRAREFCLRVRAASPAFLAARKGVLVIAGTGRPTLDRHGASGADGVNADADTSVDGDGTVSLSSATGGGALLGLCQGYALDHVALVQDEAPIGAVVSFLSAAAANAAPGR
jgi:pimeloyl-ACP methyl ester carboxylesterase